jgi:hypothetical protein
MLLGSPPDMIRGYPLRETGPAAHGGGQVREIYFTTILPRWQLFFAACFAFTFIIPSVDKGRDEKRRRFSAAFFSVKGERNTMGGYPFG